MIFTGPKLKQTRSPKVPTDGRSRPRAEGMRGILDHAQAVLARNLVDLVDSAGNTCVVHGHDRLRPLADQRSDGVRVEAERLLLDVAEHDVRAGGRDRLVAGDVRERGADDLVARPRPPAARTRGVPPCRSRRSGGGARAGQVQIVRELLLEAIREAPDRKPAAVECPLCGPVVSGPSRAGRPGSPVSLE